MIYLKPALCGLLFFGVGVGQAQPRQPACTLPDVLVRWEAATAQAFVAHVRPRSAAARLGVRLDAEILRVNGEVVAKIVENTTQRPSMRSKTAETSCAVGTFTTPETAKLHATLLAAAESEHAQSLTTRAIDGTVRTVWLPRTVDNPKSLHTRRYRSDARIVRFETFDRAAEKRLDAALRPRGEVPVRALLFDVREAASFAPTHAAALQAWIDRNAEDFTFAWIVSPWTNASALTLAQHTMRAHRAVIVGAVAQEASLHAPPIAAWRNEYGTDAVFATAYAALALPIIKP